MNDEEKLVLEKITRISVDNFFEDTPPSVLCNIQDAWTTTREEQNPHLNLPSLNIYCDICTGKRIFRYLSGNKVFYNQKTNDDFNLIFLCGNCRKFTKKYSISVALENKPNAVFYKYGELPAFGVPTPTRLLKLLGPERDLFLKGRRSEFQGLGIGAFVYYRRVVENSKQRIFDEIIKVSRKLGASANMLSTLEAGKAETQFSKSLESVKDAIPQGLLINGQNPLTLLHGALSRGLHNETDEHCLSLAHDVRLILAELAERLSQALNDEKELNAAIARLAAGRSNTGV